MVILSLSLVWTLGMMTIAVWVWAVALRVLEIFITFEASVYFSLVAFTTLGFGDLLLPQEWRLLGGLAAANGLLMFGLLTAILVETLRAEPAGAVTLCPLGPLTNIATALARAPDIAPKIAEIVLMGGAYFEVGNITPAAEFNIYVDPEAAAEVFAAGTKITVMPLDVTHKALT